jgi:hypothetical protein
VYSIRKACAPMLGGINRLMMIILVYIKLMKSTSFQVHRHGERTPDSDELSLSNQQEKLKNLTWIEGLEGLTNVNALVLFNSGLIAS